MKAISIVIMMLFLISSCHEDTLEIYFFDHEFYSTPGIKCSKITSAMGVKLIKTKEYNSMEINNIFSVLERHDDQVEGDFRNKFIYQDKTICTDLRTLLSLGVATESETELLKKLLVYIEKNNINSVDINPYSGYE